MKTVHYRNRKLRLIAAFTASFYILFHGRPFDIYRAFTSVSFYIAFAVSFGIGLLLVYAIHRATLWLDTRCSWRERPIERSLMQFTLGILAPAIIDLLLISIYFQALGQDVLNNGFLLIDYPVIVFFIILLNVYYLIHYLLLSESHFPTSQKTELTPIEKKQDSGQSNSRQGQFVLYYQREGKQVRAVINLGSHYLLNTTINYIIHESDDRTLCQINRRMIINYEIIDTYQQGKNKTSLTIKIKPDYLNQMENLLHDSLQVTKDKKEAFLRGFYDHYQ
ncbi:hypothetical protein GR160_07840 [Flavobacterium sp. Sd200]|uniref:LytTR family transcriptional regulator DNA-binding domain-containing protein n=1 Tax=Flavobacterium sp. Sd200 TaxID=2692211 RepID=UPI00136F46A2|nr:LytTR family transcriptional regulator DNA-binding domain-containing protein [Flavobacterium sp. Sd200]MXN91140.1 hypothetical protein [Flavobacterium sp. Sd200]